MHTSAPPAAPLQPESQQAILCFCFLTKLEETSSTFQIWITIFRGFALVKSLVFRKRSTWTSGIACLNLSRKTRLSKFIVLTSYSQVPTQVPTSVGNNSDIQIQHLQHGGWLCPYGTAGQGSNPRLATFLTEKRRNIFWFLQKIFKTYEPKY